MSRKKKEEVIEEAKEESVNSAPEYYILKVGETLDEVAKKFKLNAKKLNDLNGEVVGTNQIKLKKADLIICLF